jgi:hypothetical protein
MDKNLLSVLQIQLFVFVLDLIFADDDIVVVDTIRKSVVEDNDVCIKAQVCGTVTDVDVSWQQRRRLRTNSFVAINIIVFVWIPILQPI